MRASLAEPDLDPMEEARAILRRIFGHADFRGLQAEVIGEILAGRSALAVLPTGGGKSVCYQIPAMMRPGLGLVVSPLIALMADQVAGLQQSGVAAARLDLARYTNLAKTGAATTQQLDTTRALVAQTEASVKADQALIDTAQVQLNYASIRSPIEGRVGRRLVKQVRR